MFTPYYWIYNISCYILSVPPIHYACRTDPRFAPSQWETSLQSKAVSHWLGVNLEWTLCLHRHLIAQFRLIIRLQIPSGPWFNIKMPTYQYRKSYCGDKTVVRSSYSTMGFPILVRWHLFIESAAWYPVTPVRGSFLTISHFTGHFMHMLNAIIPSWDMWSFWLWHRGHLRTESRHMVSVEIESYNLLICAMLLSQDMRPFF